MAGSFLKAQTDDTERLKYEASNGSLFNNWWLLALWLPHNTHRFFCVCLCVGGGGGVVTAVLGFVLFIDFEHLAAFSRTVFIFRSQKCRVEAGESSGERETPLSSSPRRQHQSRWWLRGDAFMLQLQSLVRD